MCAHVYLLVSYSIQLLVYVRTCLFTCSLTRTQFPNFFARKRERDRSEEKSERKEDWNRSRYFLWVNISHPLFSILTCSTCTQTANPDLIFFKNMLRNPLTTFRNSSASRADVTQNAPSRNEQAASSSLGTNRTDERRKCRQARSRIQAKHIAAAAAAPVRGQPTSQPISQIIAQTKEERKRERERMAKIASLVGHLQFVQSIVISRNEGETKLSQVKMTPLFCFSLFGECGLYGICLLQFIFLES